VVIVRTFFCNDIQGSAVANADAGNVFCIADKFFIRSLDNTVNLQDSEAQLGRGSSHDVDRGAFFMPCFARMSRMDSVGFSGTIERAEAEL
jgi:hypothetical protein